MCKIQELLVKTEGDVPVRLPYAVPESVVPSKVSNGQDKLKNLPKT